jgi:superkiller protein 3
MGILTDDDGLIDAALSELKSLPLDLRHRRDPRRDFSYILKQHHLGQVSKQTIIVSSTPTHSVRPAPLCPLTTMPTFENLKK